MRPEPHQAAGAPAEEDYPELYRRMRRIRRFEQRTSTLYRDGVVPGFVHLSIGQEACAVGATWPLTDADGLTSNHRGHGHCIARGLDMAGMFAELMGREGGTCAGRGGSMHIADPSRGIYGANGIVGAGLPIAVGAATAARLQGDSSVVVVAFFGDGAVAQGTFHEAVNLAAVWELPVVFFCENNQYAEFSPAATQSIGTLADKARGYGAGYAHVDGNDVVAVAELMAAVREGLVQHPRPFLVEADTYRWHGHYEGDPQRYREEEEVSDWRERDPLQVLRRRVGDPERLDEVDAQVEEEVAAALRRAEHAAEPAAATYAEFVTVRRPHVPEPAPPRSEDVFRTMDAVREALRHELAEDPSVFVAGIDVGEGGNVFGVTRGLWADFATRVRDTPISESAVLGMAVGAAMAGMRPVVEVMYMDFLGVAFDQILNQAAKMRYMTGGQVELPLVIRTQFGAGRSSGSQHSQSLEALLAHVPGLTVVMPANPAETYGLLRAAIRDPNPVLFVENRLQYGRKGPRPPQDHLVPIGKARVVREGAHVTLVSYSRMLQEAEAAAATLADEGVDVELIDLRTVAPLDRETVLGSLRKTNRLVIAHEAVRDHGLGAELAALAADEGFWSLDAPVVRVGAPFTPAPYAPSLERAWLPDRGDIVDAVRRAVRA